VIRSSWPSAEDVHSMTAAANKARTGKALSDLA